MKVHVRVHSMRHDAGSGAVILANSSVSVPMLSNNLAGLSFAKVCTRTQVPCRVSQSVGSEGN